MSFVRVLMKTPSVNDNVFVARRLHEYAGAHAVRQCLNTCVLALGVLMAGSGNLQTLSLCKCCNEIIFTYRQLRKSYRFNADSESANSSTHYRLGTIGQHVSTYTCAHLCAGMLFLGGGAFVELNKILWCLTLQAGVPLRRRRRRRAAVRRLSAIQRARHTRQQRVPAGAATPVGAGGGQAAHLRALREP